jgi:SAM-dependent methyltransferase
MNTLRKAASLVAGRFARPAQSQPDTLPVPVPVPVPVPQVSFQTLESDYESVAREFYAYLPEDVRDIFIGDAIYHQARYIELLGRSYGPRVLELGSDKPFISHFLRHLHPHSTFDTVSIDIPFSMYPIVRVDIESEELPYEPGAFSDVIFTEVLEHLFRDPAWTIFQINRVLAMDGTLFLTTPNACGYDGLINLINLANPNARSQFFASIESGHPHLWTASECREILDAHGFDISSIDTANYVPIPIPAELEAFINGYSSDKTMHGQSLRMVATKTSAVQAPVYPRSLFPEGKPVQLQGALLEWARHTLEKQQARQVVG